MELILEQLKKLRKNRLKSLIEYEKSHGMLDSRDTTDLDGINSPAYDNGIITDGVYNSNDEEKNITHLLTIADIRTERNFEFVDIGTRFTIKYPNEDIVERMLVDEDTPLFSMEAISLKSKIGKAVKGKRVGESITCKLSETGKPISLIIEKIDSIKSNYDRFITERKRDNRRSNAVRKGMIKLQKEHPEEYKKLHQYTASQYFLICDEIQRLSFQNSPKAKRRKNFLEKYLKTNTLAKPPKDDTIDVGSIVSIIIIDKDGKEIEREFELINEAISTELESEYVEKISPLGQTLCGKRAGDTFIIYREHKSQLHGIIKNVDNKKSKVYEKHI